MKAHNVRRLRYCRICQDLDDKSKFISDDYGSTCVECAFAQAGSLQNFMETYSSINWEKLTLNMVGVNGMRTLLEALRKERDVEGESNG